MKLIKYLDRLKSFYEQSRRVWQVTRKPTMQEFRVVALVSAAGILIVGAIGFLLYTIWQFIPLFK